jgi:hypothetical protein
MKKLLVMLTAICFGSSLSLVAGPLNGTFGGNGWATVTFSNFNACPTGSTPNGGNVAGACTPGTGVVNLSGGTGSYSNVSGALNQVKSLSQGSQPVGVVVSLPNWLVFTPESVPLGGPQISLTLTEVLAGTFPTGGFGPGSPCDPFATVVAGQTCTPSGSAFNLSNQTTTSSEATFTVIGNAVDGVAGDTTPFQYTISANFQVPFQQLLQALLSNGGTGNYSSSYTVSFSAFAAAAPEPATLSLIGAGLLGLGFLHRRKRS